MFIGLLTLNLHLPGCDELKEKRHRIKGVLEKAANRFNVSISEVDDQDLHQSAVIAAVMVNSDRKIIEQVLQKVEDIFDGGNGIIISASEIEWL